MERCSLILVSLNSCLCLYFVLVQVIAVVFLETLKAEVFHHPVQFQLLNIFTFNIFNQISHSILHPNLLIILLKEFICNGVVGTASQPAKLLYATS